MTNKNLFNQGHSGGFSRREFLTRTALIGAACWLSIVGRPINIAACETRKRKR